MTAVLDALVFVAAFALTAYVIAATLVPALPRMVRLLAGEQVLPITQAAIVLAPRRAVTLRTARPSPRIWREAA